MHEANQTCYTLKERMLFMAYIMMVIIAGFSLFYILCYRESNRLITKTYTFSHKNISTQQKIIFFSDVHIGKWYHSNHLVSIVSLINQQQPDVLIFGGDFIDQYKRDKKRLDIDFIIEQLSFLTCTHKYCVKGNHDGPLYSEIMEKAGFKILDNEYDTIDHIEICGLADGLYGNPLKTFSFRADSFHIVVVHEPDVVDEIDLNDVHLVLSGHTHGGQVGIPIIKYWVLPKKGKHYIKGFYQLTPFCRFIVSSGIGRTGLPLRLGNPPEIVEIQLHKDV